MAPNQVNRLASRLDSSGDGSVSEDEFMLWHLRNKKQERGANKQSPASVASDIFEMVFEGGGDDGAVSATEFKDTLDAMNAGLSFEDIQDLIHELDEDGDGRIDGHEFASLLQKYSTLYD